MHAIARHCIKAQGQVCVRKREREKESERERKRERARKRERERERVWYGVAAISRLPKNIGLSCKRALLKRLYSAKETYNFKEPTKS